MYLSLMIKPLLHLLFLILLPLSLFGQQNLVPNFSFEQLDTCPYLEDQIQFATGWSKYSANNTTPDYFNSCASSFFNVPNCGGGYQSAHRNCDGFAGLVTFYFTSNYREYIGIQLTQPLTVGQKYFLSFYTVLSEQHYGSVYQGMPSNNIGMRLSTVAYNGNSPTPIDNFAHLFSASVINDSINWQRISGSIIADSAYNFVIIGNFFTDLNTDTLQYNCTSCQNVDSYYYVDDICVSSDSLLCNGGIDLLPCITSVSEQNLSDKINIFPNPSNGLFNIECKQIIMYYEIQNCLGKVILASDSDLNKETIDLSHAGPGIYFLKVRTITDTASFTLFVNP